MTMPAITPATFPYRRKWTRAELDDILARKDQLAAAMTDAVGPVGQYLGIPADCLHILALHVALAGGEVRDELAYIVAKPAKGGMFVDSKEWVLKKEYKPGPPPADETDAKAEAAADQIRRQLTPEVRAAVIAKLTDEFNHVEDE